MARIGPRAAVCPNMIDHDDIRAALHDLGVGARPLLVHSDLSRCLTLSGRTRDNKLATMLAGLEGTIGDGPLLVPAFTYSYCRGEDFDPARAKSTVGVFGDWVREQPGSRRTPDPIYSTVVRGELPADWERRLFSVADSDCFGPDSVFAYLRDVDAQILFFGVAATANTYVHHLEQVLGVGYRYFKDFSGSVVTADGATATTVSYFVRDLESDVVVTFEPLVDAMRDAGESASTKLERGPQLTLTSASAVERRVRHELQGNPDYLLVRGHPSALDAATR